MWLKISILIKKDVVIKYPILFQKILKILDDFNCK
jgi:hypothetical protein